MTRSKLGKALAWAGMLLAAGAPLAVAPILFSPFLVFKLFVLALALLSCSAGAVLKGETRRMTAFLDIPVLIMLAAMTVSTLFSQDRLLSFWGRYDDYVGGLWPLGLCAGLYYAAAWGFFGESNERLARACLVTASLISIYAMAQFFGTEPVAALTVIKTGRSTATLGSPVSLGLYLAMILPLAFHWALDRDGVGGLVALALVSGGLLTSITRSAWLGAAVGVVGYLALTRGAGFWRWGIRHQRVLAIFLAAAVALFVALMRGRSYDAAQTDLARLELWRMAWGFFVDRPWLGGGPDTFQLDFQRARTPAYLRLTHEYQNHVHNDLLEILATTGLLGAAAYGWLILALARTAREAVGEPTRKYLAAALTSGLLALFIAVKFNPASLESAALAGLFAGMLSFSAAAPKRRGWWGAWLILIFALFSTVHAARSFIADRGAKQAWELAKSARVEGAWRRFALVMRLDPCELQYQNLYLKFLDAWQKQPIPDDVRGRILETALRLGEQAVDCHPRNATSRYFLGLAHLLRAKAGGYESLAAAERELDAGLRLDPTRMKLAEARLEAARLRGDKAKVEELSRVVEDPWAKEAAVNAQD